MKSLYFLSPHSHEFIYITVVIFQFNYSTAFSTNFSRRSCLSKVYIYSSNVRELLASFEIDTMKLYTHWSRLIIYNKII